MRSPAAGDAPGDAWAAAAVGALRPGERVLVLCRSRATVTLVRRWAMRRGGVPGLEVALPSGLAVQLHRGGPTPDATALPPGAALAARIGDRPGLARAAHGWVRELRRRRALGLDPGAPPWLEELLATPFGVTPDDESALHLVALARARGRELTASMRWDRVVALGFDGEPAHQDPAERAIAAAMAGEPPPPPGPPDPLPPLPAAQVPDVVAEARLAATLALADPAGTLILVGSDATGRRVRDALDRNGLGGALRDPVPLTVHPVASAVRRAVDWFAGGAPSILATDLAFVLARTSLGRRLHPSVAARLAERLPDDPDRDRFDERALVEVLEAARLRDAPLERWQGAADRLADAPAPDHPDDLPRHARVRRAAVHLSLRLAILRACAQGLPLGDVVGDGVGGAWVDDDFADAVRELLGDLPGPELPPAGTLGAVARALVELRLRVHDDPGARAILGALRDRATLPATPARVHEALSGPGLDPGVLPDGVDVLPLEQWDGRPCRTLVVLDVHDHGLFRPHPPDPLLTDAEVAALGVPTGRDRRGHLVRQLHRAAATAERVVLVVTRTDASGRDTVPPVDLATTPAHLAVEVGSYGARLPLPEHARCRRLRVVTGEEQGVDPDGEPVRSALARGASLEWVAEGRHVGPPVTIPHPASLSVVLRAAGPTLPAPLRPWLGFAEGVPEAALADDEHRPASVSRLLQPLAKCAWQAFGTVVLGLRERPELTDALDPREVGTMAHQALQDASGALDFRRDADADAAVATLQAATDAAFGALLDGFPDLSPARSASVNGLRDRWKRHFRAWVAARRGWPLLVTWDVRNHPVVVAAEERLRAVAPALAASPGWLLRSWLVHHRDDRPGQVDDRELRRVDDRHELPAAAAPDLPGFLGEPAMDAVRAALAESSAHRNLVQGGSGRFTRTFVAAEVPFGPQRRATPAPVHGLPGVTLSLPAARLKFGASDLWLQGTIDRVDFLDTGSARGFVVTDYKTGRAVLSGEDFRRDQWALGDPQLLVYAMVLSRAARDPAFPEELRSPAAALAHDRVRHTFREKDAAQRVPEAPDTWMPVDSRWMRLAAQDLGALVDGARAGRWPLRPHPQRCPKLTRSAHCALADGCRLRGVAGA